MPRPRRVGRIFFDPDVTHFKPASVPLVNLKEVVLTKEELEVVRAIDYEETEQKEAAKKMNVSQPTLSRLLTSARKKIAEALVNGKSIKIQGGNYKMVTPRSRGSGIGFGRGRGRMGGFGAGPGGICVCPKCGHKEPQVRGQPCMSKKCPECGTLMTRR